MQTKWHMCYLKHIIICCFAMLYRHSTALLMKENYYVIGQYVILCFRY